jgi:hypothetical protein
MILMEEIMRLLNTDELTGVEGGAGISLDWISKQEERTGRSRVDTGFQEITPVFVPPIVEDHTWKNHPFFNTDRYVPPWFR